jgi:hypothetical protein
MKNFTKVLCSHCNKEFEKETRYVKSAEKKSRLHYCSRGCSGKHNLIVGKEKIDNWNHSLKNREHLNSIKNNRRDEFTGFRNLLSSCNKRTKDCDLSLIYLKEIWEKQKGKCDVTGVDLQLKCSYNKNYQASIDRIDSSLGYVKDNIRFVSVSVNWLKNNLNDEHLKEFIQICKMVVN